MARFFGTVQGQRGEATRLGHGSLHVTAQSYAGDVVVDMWRDHETDEEHVNIKVRAHSGGDSYCLYSGKVADLLNADERMARIQALGLDEFIKRHEEASNAAA